jgi:CHAT domain-containing protein
MARAFFASGAKVLLATLWAVESMSAKQLVVDALTAYGKDAATPRAMALATSQRSMVSGAHGELYRHPYFWAAYSTFGDPNR